MTDRIKADIFALAMANRERKPWARRWLKANGYWSVLPRRKKEPQP